MKRDTGAKKAEFVAAAVELFRQRGYAGVSVEEIVAKLGVSKGAFYHYLDSKEQLLFLIHDEFISHELALAEQALAMDVPATAKLQRMADIMIETIDCYHDHVVVFFRAMNYLPEGYLSQIKKKRDRFAEIVIEMVKQGIRDGEFREDLAPKVAAFAFLGMCNWTFQWYRPGGPMSPNNIAASFSSIFLKGFLRDASAPARPP